MGYGRPESSGRLFLSPQQSMDIRPPDISPVDIWMVDLDCDRHLVLTPEEEKRAARLRRELDRMRWARARTALREILSSRLQCGPLDFRFEIGAHGKPFIEGGPQFNLSHSGKWAAIAVSSTAEVGIDIEQLREGVNMAELLGRLGETDLPDSPPALFQRWARREAASKTTGGALFKPVDARVRVVDLKTPEGYVAAVGMLGFEPEPLYRGGR
jgi:4'-phosphopantetheinyl transferase